MSSAGQGARNLNGRALLMLHCAQDTRPYVSADSDEA
jgi:hypothetical protein